MRAPPPPWTRSHPNEPAMTASPDSSTEEHTPTVIIGAGPSGLAVGACLRRAGLPFVLLDRAEAVGASWRNHYERLHLHTVKAHSALPHMPFPDDAPRYVPRAQVVAYLESYCDRFNLNPRLGESVASVRWDDGRWITQTQSTRYVSRHVVVATGYNRVPKMPEWPGRETFQGDLMHSSAYRNGAPWRGKRAVVVGLGNSGGEIAQDLWEHGAQVAISVRSPVRTVPRDLFGVPTQYTSIAFAQLPDPVSDWLSDVIERNLLDDLSPYGLQRPECSAREQVERYGKIPLIDVGIVDLIKQGNVEIIGDIQALDSGGAVLRDGTRRDADLILCATGYRAKLADFLDRADRFTDDRGYPTAHGREARQPGLYFVGFANPTTGALRESGIEAMRVADSIREKDLNRAAYPTERV